MSIVDLAPKLDNVSIASICFSCSLNEPRLRMSARFFAAINVMGGRAVGKCELLHSFTAKGSRTIID
jgi:hypothetical protein